MARKPFAPAPDGTVKIWSATFNPWGTSELYMSHIRKPVFHRSPDRLGNQHCDRDGQRPLERETQLAQVSELRPPRRCITNFGNRTNQQRVRTTLLHILRIFADDDTVRNANAITSFRKRQNHRIFATRIRSARWYSLVQQHHTNGGKIPHAGKHPKRLHFETTLSSPRENLKAETFPRPRYMAIRTNRKARRPSSHHLRNLT